MGWRKSNQGFVHTWGPQPWRRPSNFPVFSDEHEAGDTNLIQTVFLFMLLQIPVHFPAFPSPILVRKAAGLATRLVSLRSDLMSQRVS